jgi:hypothetical protein
MMAAAIMSEGLLALEARSFLADPTQCKIGSNAFAKATLQDTNTKYLSEVDREANLRQLQFAQRLDAAIVRASRPLSTYFRNLNAQRSHHRAKIRRRLS